jgi:hypothetical protein
LKKGLYFIHKYPFLAIHAKGGESISPKQKDRTTRTAPPPISKMKSFKFVLKEGFSRKISNLENASQNLIHLPLTIYKRTLKRISKRVCKNKTSGASVVQNVKYEESIHAYLIKCILV